MAVLDMLELHQFRHSAFCLKVRMVLQAKGLSFRTVEVTPGVGQVAVFRLSGQRSHRPNFTKWLLLRSYFRFWGYSDARNNNIYALQELQSFASIYL